MDKWVLTRQHYWGVEEKDAYIVEVAFGGHAYSNPDAFVPQYRSLGEGEQFSNPIEAIEAAIEVCRAWRKSGEKRAKLGIGFTGGCTLPFEPCTFAFARTWAKKRYEQLPKCDECGDVRDEEHSYGNDFTMPEYPFCSEECADRNWVKQLKEDCDQGFHRANPANIKEDGSAECEVCGETFSTKEE